LCGALLDYLAACVCLQTDQDLRKLLQKGSGKPYSSRIADAHLLLWLASTHNMDQADLMAIIESVKNKSELMEGYKVIIDSIAGL
jgi:hypothetical protein